MARLFISYSRKDEEFARRLATDLERLGADVWLDIEDIPAGMKWSSAIQQGLDECELMLVLVSPDSMASINVEDEWQYFLDQRRPVIPVLWQPAKIHFQLNRIQYVDFHRLDYDVALNRLRNELQRQGITLQTQSAELSPVADEEAEPPLDMPAVTEEEAPDEVASPEIETQPAVVDPEPVAEDISVEPASTVAPPAVATAQLADELNISTPVNAQVAESPLVERVPVPPAQPAQIEPDHHTPSSPNWAITWVAPAQPPQAEPETSLARMLARMDASDRNALVSSSTAEEAQAEPKWQRRRLLLAKIPVRIRLAAVLLLLLAVSSIVILPRLFLPALIHTFSGHTSGVNTVAFSPDGKQALTGSDDGTARLWDVATGKPLYSFDANPGSDIRISILSVAFSTDGRQALIGSGVSTTWLWDVTTGKTLQIFRERAGIAAFSPDGKLVLTGGSGARLWDITTGQTLQTFSGHTDGVTSVAFSPSGKQVLTGSADKTARLWDVTTGQTLQTFSGHTDGVTSVAFSPSGKQVLTGSADKTARLWDVTTGQTLQTFSGHLDRVSGVAFSPDGSLVLTGSYDKTARLWDAVTGKVMEILSGHLDRVSGVAFSPDGRLVLTCSDYTAKLWMVRP